LEQDRESVHWVLSTGPTWNWCHFLLVWKRISPKANMEGAFSSLQSFYYVSLLLCFMHRGIILMAGESHARWLVVFLGTRSQEIFSTGQPTLCYFMLVWKRICSKSKSLIVKNLCLSRKFSYDFEK
jgi:hypothetical protein